MTKPKKRVMKEFAISEISLVDNPAQPQARIAILKRDEPMAKNRRALTTMTAGHAHSIILMDGYSDIKAGRTSFAEMPQGADGGHSHDWVMDDAGNIIIAESHGHTHGVGVLVKCVDDLPQGEELDALLKGVDTPGRTSDNPTDTAESIGNTNKL